MTLLGVAAAACGAPDAPEIVSVDLAAQGTMDVRFSEPMTLHERFKPYSFRLSVAYPVGEDSTAFVDLGVLDELGFDAQAPCSGDARPIPRHAPFAVSSIETPADDRFVLVPNYAPGDEQLPVCEAIEEHRAAGGEARFVLHYRQLTGADPLQSEEGAHLEEVARFWPANGTNCDVVPVRFDELPAQVSIETCPFGP